MISFNNACMNNPNKNSTHAHTTYPDQHTLCSKLHRHTVGNTGAQILSDSKLRHWTFYFRFKGHSQKSFHRGNELPSLPSSGTEITPCHHLCLPHVLLFQRANGISPLGPTSVELATDPICHLHFKCVQLQLNNMKSFRVLTSSVRI